MEPVRGVVMEPAGSKSWNKGLQVIGGAKWGRVFG